MAEDSIQKRLDKLEAKLEDLDNNYASFHDAFEKCICNVVGFNMSEYWRRYGKCLELYERIKETRKINKIFMEIIASLKNKTAT